MARLDTSLESSGAEFLVLGHLLLATMRSLPPHRHINRVMRSALTLPTRLQRNFFHLESGAAEAFGEGGFGAGGPDG